MEAPPADNNADAAALALEAPPDNNADAVADASDVEFEFDWQPVSIIEILWIHLYYEFIYIENSLIYEFTYLWIYLHEMQEQLVGDMGVVAVSPYCHFIFLLYLFVCF